jgi:hypothetical protein
VFMENVHRLMKSVAGVPSLRPTWFFDNDAQGEALSDVGTHLVDLALSTAFAEQFLCSSPDVSTAIWIITAIASSRSPCVVCKRR